MAYEKLTDITAYTIAMQIGEEVWKATTQWDFFARDTVGKQLVRCADSIAANIAEGHGRYHKKERHQFLIYARGSTTETWCFIEKCRQRALMSSEQTKRLQRLLTKVVYEINKRRKYISSLTQAA